MRSTLLSIAVVVLTPAVYAQTTAAVPAMPVPAQRELVGKYCAGCHNDKLKSGGFSFASLDLAHPEQASARAERVILKLRAGMMPPAGLPRPDNTALKSFATALENEIDQSVKPSAGRPALHRLNRTEYANSIRDLLGVDVDVASLLPADDMSHGFDNMADVLTISPTLMEGYIRAAGKIARAAVGDPKAAPALETYKLPRIFSQTRHVEGTPFGTRGGLAVTHNFPADADYIFKLTFYYSGLGAFYGQNVGKGQQIEIAINGERVALLDLNPFMKLGEYLQTPPLKVKAGPQLISAAFIEKFDGPVEDDVQPVEQSLVDVSNANVPGLTSLPHLHDIAINGPYKATGVSDTPSRRRIFICRPIVGADEVGCAKKIIANLTRSAYRRPATEADNEELLNYFQLGRNDGDFDTGIRTVVQAVIANPEFVFRFERTPQGVNPGQTYRIADLELASRLSFFLWSSAPDETLISLATQNKLHEPAVLEQQVRRMLADARSKALAESFAGQWLQLQNLKNMQPDDYLYPNYDRNLMEGMKKETELFFANMLREDRPVLDLLTANYTYVDERLAKHYGIPNVLGNRFRRVDITDDNRRGLLGQASILTLTSLANRTSPVARGKWVMGVLLGAPAPTPPPNVPPLRENSSDSKALSVRQRMEAHRANPVCAACHKMMDPIGFSLDNFDSIGQWRVKDAGFDVDASSTLYDGTKAAGPADLRRMLLSHSEAFVRNFTSELLMYGLGRVLEPTDMPTVRAIDRDAEKNNFRLSNLVMGVVKSTPFQMRKAEEPSPSSDVAPAPQH